MQITKVDILIDKREFNSIHLKIECSRNTTKSRMRLKIRRKMNLSFICRQFVCRIRKLFFIFKSGNWFQSTNQLKAIEKKAKLIAMRKRRRKTNFKN